jgi:hypothetical protein
MVIIPFGNAVFDVSVISIFARTSGKVQFREHRSVYRKRLNAPSCFMI